MTRASRHSVYSAGVLFIVTLFGAISLVHAQDSLRIRYGMFGGIGWNGMTADFRALPDIPNCCNRFESGSGMGFQIGGLVEIPVGEEFLLGFRVGYVAHGGELTQREGVRLIVDGTGRDGAFEHSLDAGIGTLGLEPRLGYRLFGDLFLHLGFRGGLYATGTFLQEERIVDPSDAGTFLDSTGGDSRSRVRNQFSGDLPGNAVLLMQGTASLTLDLPLNERRTLILSPELSFARTLTDFVDGINWKSNELRGGISIKYSPRTKPPKPIRNDTLIVRDTVTVEVPYGGVSRVLLVDRIEANQHFEEPDTTRIRVTVTDRYRREVPKPPPMTCTVAATGVDDAGNESPVVTLEIEEFLSTIAHPLLNYIFFDQNRSDIPSRYTRLEPTRAADFHPERLQGVGTLPVYYTMLNIIGQRMRKYSNATLTLTGCNMDGEEEKGNLELSRLRAESVRDYLSGVWGIDQSRLRVEAVNLPEKKSNPLTPDGQAEDRRVEISSTLPEILDVLVIDDTVRTSAPPIVRLRPVITSVSGVTGWRITIRQAGVVLKEFSGNGTPPAGIDWDLANDQQSVPRYDGPLEITMTATNAAGQVSGCVMSLPTDVRTIQEKRANRSGDFTIDRYNLILFNVGESGITPTNQRVINLVKGRLKPASQLTIEGFADRSGNASANQRLSARRAAMTAESLGRADAVTRGIGESRLLYTNDLPEGRFYCRTVQIEVRTRVGE